VRPTERAGGLGLLCDEAADKRVKLSCPWIAEMELAGHQQRTMEPFLGRQVADLQALLAWRAGGPLILSDIDTGCISAQSNVCGATLSSLGH